MIYYTIHLSSSPFSRNTSEVLGELFMDLCRHSPAGIDKSGLGLYRLKPIGAGDAAQRPEDENNNGDGRPSDDAAFLGKD